MCKSSSASLSRMANSSAIPSAASRRPANSTASRDDASTHCRSSTTTRTGCCSAISARTPSVAAHTENRSPATGGPRASALRSAARCGAGNVDSSGRAGRKMSARPANGISDSVSYPRVASTCMSVARSTAYSRRLDLPMPASPLTTSTPHRPERAVASNSSMRAHSTDRPSNMLVG
jgi:hypothetical protein